MLFVCVCVVFDHSLSSSRSYTLFSFGYICSQTSIKHHVKYFFRQYLTNYLGVPACYSCYLPVSGGPVSCFSPTVCYIYIQQPPVSLAWLPSVRFDLLCLLPTFSRQGFGLLEMNRWYERAERVWFQFGTATFTYCLNIVLISCV